MQAPIQLLRCRAGPPVGPLISLQEASQLAYSSSHCCAHALPCLVLNTGASGMGGAPEHARRNVVAKAIASSLIPDPPCSLAAVLLSLPCWDRFNPAPTAQTGRGSPGRLSPTQVLENLADRQSCVARPGAHVELFILLVLEEGGLIGRLAVHQQNLLALVDGRGNG